MKAVGAMDEEGALVTMEPTIIFVICVNDVYYVALHWLLTVADRR
jgi:hypothetical protein